MKPLVPEITKLTPLTVLTITSHGDPNKVMEEYMKSLYGTAYAVKMKVYKPQGKKVELGPLIGRWPDAHLKPKRNWTGIWGLPISNFVRKSDLIQKNPDRPVQLESWKYGSVAQILHIGPYTEEGPTVQLLHDFIKKEGYVIDGNSHEEVYLTSPKAKTQKTIIRYKVKRPV